MYEYIQLEPTAWAGNDETDQVAAQVGKATRAQQSTVVETDLYLRRGPTSPLTNTMSQPSQFAELAALLNVTEIENSTLQLCAKLLDQGIDPTRLARAIKSIQAQTKLE